MKRLLFSIAAVFGSLTAGAALAGCSQLFEAEFLDGEFELEAGHSHTDCLEFSSDRRMEVAFSGNAAVDVVIFENTPRTIGLQAALGLCRPGRGACSADDIRRAAQTQAFTGGFRPSALSETIAVSVPEAAGACVAFVNLGTGPVRLQRRVSTTPE